MRAAGPTGAGGGSPDPQWGRSLPRVLPRLSGSFPMWLAKTKRSPEAPPGLGNVSLGTEDGGLEKSSPALLHPPPPPSHFLCLLLRLCVRLRAINPRFLLDGDSKSPAALCLFALFSSSLSPSGRWHVFLVFFFGVTCGFVTPALLPDKVALPHPARPPGSPAAVTFSSLQTQR